jgi:PAP2 superfamily
MRASYLFLSVLYSLFWCRISPAYTSNAVRDWEDASIQGVRDSKLGAPMAARALAIVDTCIYDAWSAYDDRATGTQLNGVLRRPPAERTWANKERAASFAAYRALADVLPVDIDSIYTPLMKKLGYDPTDDSMDIETASGIGNVACAAVLEFRHHDKANQLGDLAPGAYSDWTAYDALNPPGTVPGRFQGATVMNPDHWQPLIYVDANGNLVSQKFVGAQWCFVTPFALTTGEQFRRVVDPGPAMYGTPEYQQQAEELVAISAALTDQEKMIAEYWQDGPNSEQPPGHWMRLAQFVSERDHHSLDDDVKMFFALSNAMLDASIAAWDAKRFYDSVRPVTAISFLFRDRTIKAWGGPGKGTVRMDGSQWIPYQLATSPTPPFPEYVSGHSTYSSAAARILALWTGSDQFRYSVTLAKGSSHIESGVTPKQAIVLKWDTFAQAAESAGMSRRYGGIHFSRADLAGRALGKSVADNAWAKASAYFDGTNSSQLPHSNMAAR